MFESSSPADYAKVLINTKNPDKNKETVAEIEDRISDLKDRIKEMSEREKKVRMKHSGLLERFLITIKGLKIFFRLRDKGKSEPKPEEGIAKRVKLKTGKIAKIKRVEKNHKQ